MEGDCGAMGDYDEGDQNMMDEANVQFNDERNGYNNFGQYG